MGKVPDLFFASNVAKLDFLREQKDLVRSLRGSPSFVVQYSIFSYDETIDQSREGIPPIFNPLYYGNIEHLHPKEASFESICGNNEWHTRSSPVDIVFTQISVYGSH